MAGDDANSPLLLGHQREPQRLADWTGLYDGLMEGQVEAINRGLETRADLTRGLP